MARYVIETRVGTHDLWRVERHKRDAAALAYENQVYDSIRACGLLDRTAGHRAMNAAQLAYDSRIFSTSVKILDFTSRFARVK